MAIAVLGGHVSRALDFYNSPNKYFIIGGTEPWSAEDTPPNPDTAEFRLRNIVGLRKVTRTEMVIPVDSTENNSNVITYRNQKWKPVIATRETSLSSGVTAGSRRLKLESFQGLSVGSKIRVGDIYDCTILSLPDNEGFIDTDTQAPENISAGIRVIGGAIVEGAKYVYIECSLDYDNFPVISPSTGEKYFYRQIGLCSNTVFKKDTEGNDIDKDILLAAEYSSTGEDEFESIGILEVLDNRLPASRDEDQKEMLSLVIEF